MFEDTKNFVEIWNPSVPITRDNGIKIELDYWFVIISVFIDIGPSYPAKPLVIPHTSTDSVSRLNNDYEKGS